MIYVVLVGMFIIAVILIKVMLSGLKDYNRLLRLNAQSDYYQARMERFIK